MRSVNAVLRALGRTPLDEETVSHYVGDGATLLLQRALGLAPPPRRWLPPPPSAELDAEQKELSDCAVAMFLEYYDAHKLDATALYPGVDEGLRALRAAGARLAVLTNKPVRPSVEIVEHLGIAGLFEAVYGGNSFAQKKPDPMGIQVLLAQCGVEPRQAVMIGDSAVDVRAGRNAGVWTAGVSYGFAPESFAQQPPDVTAASFGELSAVLLQAMAE